MSEQFALNEGFGNGGGIDRDERFTLPPAQAMDSSCGDLFARPAFSSDHDGNIAFGHAFNQRKHLAHRFASTDKFTRARFHFDSSCQALSFAS